MACSKLFSGELPELIDEVIQYFRYDHKTLRSYPFSIKFPKNYQFIEIYLRNLNDDYKTKLNEYVVHNDLFPSNTLFNYPSFIQRLDVSKVCNSIEKWIATVESSTTEKQYSSYSIRDTILLYSLIELIYKSLFLIFIENEVNLHSFEVTMTTDHFYLIIELILQNPNFICNIKHLKINVYKITNNMTNFLNFIYSNCNSISSLYILFIPTYYEKSLSQIIKSKENLKKLSFTHNYSPSYDLLLSLKNYNCSNTLNTIIFHNIDFNYISILAEIFNQLNVLESIHIIYCHSLDSKFIQQIINITKPFKLKSLFLHNELQIESLKFLIQKSGNYLENFGIADNISQQILHLIVKYCSKIKYLGPVWSYNESVNILLSLIENITQNLNYLTINDRGTSILLQNLGQILPFKLEYLNLGLSAKTSDLEVFLKNSQNTFIKKLLIKNNKKEESQDIFPSIKEYIMKKKRVKYLAILETCNGKSEDLFSQKDKVKEFQLYDIQVSNYDDLFINVYDFINEID
ncbi:hypothetical protein GLOIN_2v1779684 [Rhizophagus irregularis DAOM 181602=DAOM 197198]|nr:hypothetical protein GLOIN_2v1779684 [Rhizophagus irregularis DAOM 181602=DAOM 197198]